MSAIFTLKALRSMRTSPGGHEVEYGASDLTTLELRWCTNTYIRMELVLDLTLSTYS
jgi:hypothetical protein